MKYSPTILSISASFLAALLLAPAAALSEPSLDYFGDLRLGYFATKRQSRDDVETTDESLRLRARLGAQTSLSEAWHWRTRVAGRYTTDQDQARFWLKAWAPTRTGLDDGDATIDEFYFDYAPEGRDWSLRLGRFQGKFALPGVASKSFDRNDSPNVDITWTDGAHLQYRLGPTWRSHLVLQANASSGTGQAARAPLTFDDSGSRVTTFAALEATAPWGPLTQRLFAVTWMPDTLATDGLGATTRDDYFALTAKLFAEWPIGTGGMRGGIGGEAGWAPNTPVESVVNAGDNRSADGVARQFSFNLYDFAPGHHLAFVYGRAGAGWLISPDFRNNDRLQEIRYQWRFSRTWSMETRLRRREEIAVPEGAPRARIDDDFYLRFTKRF
jgi:hypothetical protein